jgi:methyl coenzyme M reductase subunit C
VRYTSGYDSGKEYPAWATSPAQLVTVWATTASSQAQPRAVQEKEKDLVLLIIFIQLVKNSIIFKFKTYLKKIEVRRILLAYRSQ